MKRRSYLRKTDGRSFEENSASGLKLVLQYSTVIIALMTSLLYLFGRVYHESYLSYWGLSDEMFSISKDTSVIAGFWRYFLYSLQLLPGLKIVMWGGLSVMVAVLISCYRPVAESLDRALTSMWRSIELTIRRNAVITGSHERAINFVQTVTNVVAGLFVITLLFAYSSVGIINQAKERAQNAHQNIIAGTPSGETFDSKVVLYVRSYTKGFDLYSGHLITASASHCACYRKDTGVSIFPIADISRMVIREDKKAIRK